MRRSASGSSRCSDARHTSSQAQRAGDRGGARERGGGRRMTEDEKRKLGFKRVFRMVVERGEEVREQRVPVHLTRAELALVIDALVAYEPNEEGAATAAATLRR